MVATFATSNNADTSKLAAVLDAPDSTYSFLYFDTIGMTGPTRQLLALSGVSWTQLYPQDWANEDGLDKASTPFEVMPVLYVHSKDGSQTAEIAESKVIDLYLAQKHGFVGKNSYEQSVITAFWSSSCALWDNFIAAVLALDAAPEVRQQQVQIFFTTKVPAWIRIHEHHLQANGKNGHYVGDSISLADLKSYAIISLFNRFPQETPLLSAEKTPGLLKLVEAVETHPKLQEWQATELFKSLRPSRLHPALPQAAGVRLNDRQGNKTGGIAP
ncbi:hypothetical protein B0O80DRAFT_426167 [Mortierella sp. GBAus27b]|nr:hypothetical protein BGX31_010802 [Mortierella sp. GBA43]KAI8354918.1 hypothetical protein B0O80DRAFT_426167 [Mortierella sp. GBAus27b]